MAGNNDGGLRPDKVSTEYIPDLLAEIKGRLDTAFGRFEKDIIKDQVNRIDYVLIDGHPLTKYIADALEANGGDMTFTQKIEQAPAMILNALVQGKRVSWCVPDARTGAFKADQLQTFAPPADLENYLESPEIKHEMLVDLGGRAMPAVNLADNNQIEAEEAETVQLLEQRSKFSLDMVNTSNEGFLKQDFLRDIKNANPDKSIQEILDDIHGPKDLNITMDREAFVNHAVAMLILEGADPEIIYDPERGADLRADAGRRLYQMCKDKDIDAIMNINLAFAQKAETVIENELKKLDLTDEKVISSPRGLAIAQLSKCNFDLLQERDRHKDRCYELLAAQMGGEIKTAEDKQKYAGEYVKLADKTNALGNLTLMAVCRRMTAEAGLGFADADGYRNNTLPRIVKSQLVQSLISEAQRNGESVAEKLDSATMSKVEFFDTNIENGTAEGKEAYDNLANNITAESMRANAKALFDGSFRANNRFTVEYRKNGEAEVPVPVFEEGNDGLSRHTDHSKAERDFYTAEFVQPSEEEFPHPGSVGNNLDIRVFAVLRDQFNIITTDKSGQDRLYRIDENNQLVALDGIDFSADGRKELRTLAYQGKLFAVKENENAPVQLQFSLLENTNTWYGEAADCLDHEPEPVPYRWYHAIGRIFGIASCIAQKEAHDNYLKRAALTQSIKQVAESRKPLTTFEEVSKKNFEKEQAVKENKLIDVERAAVNSKTAMKAISELYGTKPFFREKLTRESVYTREEFDSLKQYDLGLKDGPEIGTTPGKDAEGRIEFRENDFIALSMAAALTPELGGESRKDGADTKELDPQILVDANHTMYMNDLAMNYNVGERALIPRAGAGVYVKNTIAPARDIAANAIEQYRAGNRKPLAALIANGIAFAGRNYTGAENNPSAALMAVSKYMAAYGDLLKADPELEKEVRVRFEEDKQRFREARRENQIVKDAFNAEHGEYLRTVTNEMNRRKAEIDAFEKKGQGAEKQAAIEEQNRYFDEHPEFLDLVQKAPKYDVIDKFYEMCEDTDIDSTIDAMNSKLRAIDALEKGSEALAEIKRADIENRSLTPEQNTKLMKDIIRAELVKTHDSQVNVALIARGDEKAANVESIARLNAEKLLPVADMNYPETVIRNQSNSIGISSLRSGSTAMYNNAETRTGSSPVTKALTDPEKGDAELDKIYNAAFPNGANFGKMQPKYLLEHANNVPKAIAQYQKDVIAQKQAELRQAANNAPGKNLEANAAAKVNEAPQQGAIQMGGMN